MVGGPCDFSVSPSPFGLDFGTLDFGTSDLGLTTSPGYLLPLHGEVLEQKHAIYDSSGGILLGTKFPDIRETQQPVEFLEASQLPIS